MSIDYLDDLKERQKKLDHAMIWLAAGINKHFPLGSQVLIEWGRGWCQATVAHHAHSQDVIVRTASGKVHHVHWSRVELVRLQKNQADQEKL